MSLKEISDMTGVSVSTVGRILNDPKHKCSNEETKKKVLEAARKIGYVPNLNARNLKSGGHKEEKVRKVIILITRINGETTDPFYEEMTLLLEKALRDNNCVVGGIWYKNEFSDEKFSRTNKFEKLINELYNEETEPHDGLVIIGKCTERAIKAIKKHERNIISINRNTTNYEIDEVICNGEKIAFKAVSYLSELHHTKVGYVGYCHNESRFTGYQKAIQYFHLNPDIDYIYDTAPNEENGYKAMEYFSSLSNPPTGIYSANDILAIGMIKYMNRHRSMSYNPSIISSDNIDESQHTRPMLTTISLPKNEMARFAVMILLDRINRRHQISVRLEFEGTLIIRESCRMKEAENEPEYYI